MRILLLLLIPAMISSCGMRQEKALKQENAVKEEALQKGSEIASLSQSALMKAVSRAMQAGGPAHAVDYCNLEALEIKDSLSELHNCQIQRLALKYRNPKDKPVTEAEIAQLREYENAVINGDTVLATVHLFDDRAEYYQPIIINNGTCLVCHGDPETQIAEETMNIIMQRYPDDRATGFALNDFRGVWKVTFPK